jgi:hypothetical protein
VMGGGAVSSGWARRRKRASGGGEGEEEERSGRPLSQRWTRREVCRSSEMEGVQQPFDEDNLQKPAKYPFREL